MAGSLSMATPERTPDTDTVTTNTDFVTQTPEGSDYESDDDSWTIVAVMALKKDNDGNWTVREPGVGAAVTQEVPKLKHKLKNKVLEKPDSS